MKKNIWILVAGLVLLVTLLAIRPVKQVVRDGDTVAINYNLVLEDGTVYYSSVRRKPLKGTIGGGTLLPGLEEELIGMSVGETKTFTLPPEKAYGEYRVDLVGSVERSWLPEGVQPVVGKQVKTRLEDGTEALVRIKSFTNTTITLDGNHPLAGKVLTFQIELLSIDRSPIVSGQMDLANLNWVILALGISTVGFVLFRRRNRTKSIVARKSLHPRAVRR